MRVLILPLLLLFVTAARAADGGLPPELVSAPLSLPVTLAGNDIALEAYVIRPDHRDGFPSS